VNAHIGCASRLEREATMERGELQQHLEEIRAELELLRRSGQYQQYAQSEEVDASTEPLAQWLQLLDIDETAEAAVSIETAREEARRAVQGVRSGAVDRQR
jgi:hypothetical protein